jgi:thiol:disulfide interchange protein DsbD
MVVENRIMRGEMTRSWRRLIPGAVAVALAAGNSAVASVPVPEAARAVGAFDDGDPRVEARLLVHPDDLHSSRSVRIGVLFDLDPGWHLYWRNPGETGLPTVLRWQVDGGEVGATAWPAPSVFAESEGLFTSYGYADQVLLGTEVQLQEGDRRPRVARVDAELLACEIECIPAKLSLSRSLGAEEDAPDAAAATTRQLFERYAGRLPVAPERLDLELDAIFSQTAIRPGDLFRAAIAVRSCASGVARDCQPLEPVRETVAFFPDAIESIELKAGDIEPHPTAKQAFLIQLEGRAGPGDPGHDQGLRGVLALRGADGALRHVEVDLPLPRARAGAEVISLGDNWLGEAARQPDGAGVGFLHAVLLALLGGLVLNLMPCVLPVLTIKVVAVAALAHRNRGELLAHGLAYTSGIQVTMAALAAVVMLLRSAGTSVGWGFQFQEPLFVAAIGVVLVVFALNLFGVFEIQFAGGALGRIGQQATGVRRSFFEGLLAVVLATPCTAPFLGTAVGFAFAGSGSDIFAIFLAIGLGLAAPLVLVSLVPAWARWIPRSGAWMLKLKAGLGFALLATVIWLLWIVGRTRGADGVIALNGLLLVVAFAAWLHGLAQAGDRTGPRVATGLGLLLVACGGLALLPRGASEALPPVPSDGTRAWRPFEPAAVAQELGRGRRVFVYFTADWCLTCKVNEHRVIANRTVRAELERMDVAVFRADWTRRDEGIRSELARFGKAGVPLYLVYDPSAPTRPKLLPEVLTAETLLAALADT